MCPCVCIGDSVLRAFACLLYTALAVGDVSCAIYSVEDTAKAHHPP